MKDIDPIWYPFTPMAEHSLEPPLKIASGEGIYLVDEEGNRYIDGFASLWTNVHGHNHQDINRAIKRQVDQICHSTLLGLSHGPAVEFARDLIRIAPSGLTRVFYSDSGSTAVEVALKQSFQYWKQVGQPEKKRFAHLENSYHGDTIGAVSVGGIDLFHQIYGSLLFESYQIPMPVGPFGLVDKSKESLAFIRELFEERAHSLAGLVVEPLVQGAAGILVHPQGHLRALAQLCREYNVHLIVDEVATGFGRTGRMFACEWESVSPDFLCLAKGITGGYLPLAATLSTDKIYEAFLAPREAGKTFFHGHTYTGNPLACAAGIASLGLFEKEQTLENVNRSAAALRERLEKLANHGNVIAGRSRGLMSGIEFVADKASVRPYPKEKQVGHAMAIAVRKYGIILRNLGDTLVFMPPLTIGADQVHQVMDVIEKVMKDLL